MTDEKQKEETQKIFAPMEYRAGFEEEYTVISYNNEDYGEGYYDKPVQYTFKTPQMLKPNYKEIYDDLISQWEGANVEYGFDKEHCDSMVALFKEANKKALDISDVRVWMFLTSPTDWRECEECETKPFKSLKFTQPNILLINKDKEIIDSGWALIREGENIFRKQVEQALTYTESVKKMIKNNWSRFAKDKKFLKGITDIISKHEDKKDKE